MYGRCYQRNQNEQEQLSPGRHILRLPLPARLKREFVIRCPRRRAGVVRAFRASTAREQGVELCGLDRQKDFVGAPGLAHRLRVRLVKIELEDGAVEVLGTSLLDTKTFPAADLKRVYDRRWGVETYYDRLKNIFAVERFSGRSVLSSEQDFFGLILLTTLEWAQAALTPAQSSAEGSVAPWLPD